MGCDGGTIPKRDELVRLKKKPEQKDKDAEREFRWLHCALNQQRLQEPIVMCGLGRLYSKQSIIEQLLEKEKMPEAVKHIKNMKDVKQLNLTPNPAYDGEDKTKGLLESRNAPYICKLIGLEMSGRFPFVALWSCGCVMSERALKEIKSRSSGNCPLCQKPFFVEDIIILNASDEDLELMKAKIEMRRAKKKANKKASLQMSEGSDLPSTSKFSEVKVSLDKQSTSCANLTTSTQTFKAKIVANHKRLGVTSDALEDPELKRLKTDYSVAKDPKASDVYKSLFTSHKSEQEQTRAHWVTYNPFYN